MFSQNKFLSHSESTAKRIYFAVIGFICVASLVMIFFYAYLIPLHEDEAGYWLNFTNKTIENRRIPNDQIPNHTLVIYGAKLSLKVFGYNGIGYRFPVIFFSLLSVGVMFVLARQFLKSDFKASLAVGLMFLCPWYLHHSHELRGYTSYLFFALVVFILLDRILKEGDRPALWVLMLGAFVGCYYSSMGSVVFIFNFMATLWILKVAQWLMPQNERLSSFQAISFSSFFIFSLVATGIMAFIIFNLDLLLILKNRGYQIIHGDTPWSSVEMVKLASDIFSTFLGYRYLDDPPSILYHYPLPVWIFSLVCFFYGLKLALDSRQTPALIFVTLFATTFIFNLANQHYIQTRAVCYLLPFLLIYQTVGLIGLIKAGIKRTRFKTQEQERIYGILAGILLIYFSMLSIGKYQNLEAKSGNPYEQVKSFLLNETGSTDLIISSLRDTVGGFYLGDTIRDHTSNIFNNDHLEAIIYLTRNHAEEGITLKNYFLQPEEFIDLSRFSKVAQFENHGVRGKQIFVYKSKLKESHLAGNLSQDILKKFEYVGGDGKLCRKEMEGKDFKLLCEGTLACTRNEIKNSNIEVSQDHYQLLIFYNIKDSGTRHPAIAVINRPEQLKGGFFVSDGFFSGANFINLMVDDLDDLDRYGKNIVSITPSLQQLNHNQGLILCMAGDLFHGNSLIKRIKLFNFKL